MKKALDLVLVLVLALGLVIPHVGCGVQDIGDQTAMTTAGPGRIDVDNIPGDGVTGGTDHDFCEPGEPDEWHFLISDLDPKEAAPAHMTAVFAVEGEVGIPLEKVSPGGAAHYTLVGYLDATLVGGYAYLEEQVTYNGFILSHAPCDDGDCDDDCDDQNACTIDTCENGVCVHTSIDGLGDPARILPDEVLPGERFQVTAVFTAPYDGFHAIALTDVAPDGWDVSVNVAWADPEATAVHTPTAETAAYVWYGPYDVCVLFTTVYEVRVPVNAEPGTYTFSGFLKYYIEPHPAPAYEQEVTGDMHVRVKEGETVKIEGVAKEVDGAILSEAAVVLYQNGEAIGNIVSDESGNYEFEFSELGDYEVMVSKAGFRSETQSISVAALAIYSLDFVGDHGLIPDAPSMSYVLACISLWKFGELPLQLSTSRVLDVTSAWTYPIT
jgi:hypothetical protein